MACPDWVALKMLVKASLELPGFLAAERHGLADPRQVNTAIFDRIVARMSLPDRVRLEDLLNVVGPQGKSPFNRLKQPAGAV